jgi:hypothetical protein
MTAAWRRLVLLQQFRKRKKIATGNALLCVQGLMQCIQLSSETSRGAATVTAATLYCERSICGGKVCQFLRRACVIVEVLKEEIAGAGREEVVLSERKGVDLTTGNRNSKQLEYVLHSCLR